MLSTRTVVLIYLPALLFLGTSAASGQEYPNKPIRIFTSNVGGGGDAFSRTIARVISAPLGQSVIVENRNTLVATETVAKLPPDGYGLLYGGSGMMFTPLLQKTSYDPLRDFSPITMTATIPNVVVVHPSLPVRSIKELIALAKAKPGQLNFASPSRGSSVHIAGELFNIMAGVKIVHIAYKGSGVYYNDLFAGEIQVGFPAGGSVMPHLKSGRIRGLAVTSAQPTPLVPGLPTVAASGIPGYEIVSIDAMWAPAGTPAIIVNRLNQEIVRALVSTEVKEQYAKAGAEVTPSSPQQLAARMKTDIATTAKVIKDAGIQTD